MPGERLVRLPVQRASLRPAPPGKNPVKLLWSWSRRVGKRQRVCARGHGAVAHEALEPCRRAQHKHFRFITIHTEGMRYSHRHDRRRAWIELKAPVASLLESSASHSPGHCPNGCWSNVRAVSLEVDPIVVARVRTRWHDRLPAHTLLGVTCAIGCGGVCCGRPDARVTSLLRSRPPPALQVRCSRRSELRHRRSRRVRPRGDRVATRGSRCRRRQRTTRRLPLRPGRSSR